MKKLIFLLLFSSSAYADTDLSIFFDPNRNLNIVELSHFHKPSEKIEIYGFLESYKNSGLGFPQEKVVVFGKTRAMYNVTKKFSVGVEVEHGVNNAGMFSTSRKFEQDRLFLLPKIGIKINLE